MIVFIRKLQERPLLFGSLCVLLATLGLSLKAIFIKLTYIADPQIDGISILAIRFFLALPFFLLLLFYASKKQPSVQFRRHHIRSFLFLGMVGFYVSALLDFTALAYIPAGLERLILFLYPTFVVLISMVMRPGEVTRTTIVALLVSYCGLIVVFLDQAHDLSADMMKGALMVLGAAMVFAVYTVASVKPIQEHGSIRFTAYAMFAASAATIAHALLVHGLQVFDHSLRVYALVLPMAIFSTVLPLILMAEGIRYIGASSSSIIATSGPVITLSLAFVFLGETVGLLQIMGGLLIMGGVFFIAKKPGKATI